MAATGYMRGYPVVFEEGAWLYADDHSPATIDRPCAKCQKPPTVEGYDACLGHIPGATSACCGHGVEPGYVVIGGERRPLNEDEKAREIQADRKAVFEG